MSLMNRLGVSKSILPKRQRFFAHVMMQWRSARVMATYSRRLSSSSSLLLLMERGLGNMFSSTPTMKTVPNSSPFALCMVINETRESSSFPSLSRSVSSETSCKKSDNDVSFSWPSSLRLATKSCMLFKSSSRFSWRDNASGLLSPYKSALIPLSLTILTPSSYTSNCCRCSMKDVIIEWKLFSFA